MNLKLRIPILAIFAAFRSQLDAQTITFDDLPDSTSGLAIPAGYYGFQWNNFGCLDGLGDVGNSGYPVATITPKNVAYNGGGNPASFTSPVPFNFISAYLTLAHLDNLQVEIQGYASGVLTYDSTYTLSATNPTLIEMNFRAVDEVDFISSGGTPHPGYRSGGEQFAMDNLSVKVPPPDLAATEVYFRDQPGNTGNRVNNPVVGQQLYPYFSYTLAGHDVSGTIWNINLDGVNLFSYSTSDEAPGNWTGWCSSPWTVTAGNHTLQGVLDPNGTIAETNEFNNITNWNFTSSDVPGLTKQCPRERAERGARKSDYLQDHGSCRPGTVQHQHDRWYG